MFPKKQPQTQGKSPDDGEGAFKKWLAQVDVAIAGRVFVSLYDLPDQPYRDWFEEGSSPAEAANMALEDAGFDDGQEAMSGDDMFYEALWD